MKMKILLVMMYCSWLYASSEQDTSGKHSFQPWVARVEYNDYSALILQAGVDLQGRPLVKKLVDAGFTFEQDPSRHIIVFSYPGLCPLEISDKVLWFIAQQRVKKE
jgi:hypothetical protein